MSGPDKKKLDKMIWQLREGWGESTRIEAARDLGWIGTQAADEAVPELIKALLEDKSENVRVEAAIYVLENMYEVILRKACNSSGQKHPYCL